MPTFQVRTPAVVLFLAAGLTAGLALVPAGSGSLAPRPAQAVSQGMFKVICDLSHRAKDDPIVFPRQPGKAHLHDFFGNRSTDAYSTLPSLRSSGTTCANPGDKAAYWVPALYQDGKLVTPKEAQVYYRASNSDIVKIRPFPSGLKMVAGDPTAMKPQPLGVAAWNCGTVARFQDTSPPTCRSGENLRVRIRFPECWDGTHLDSADHRSHLAYLVAGGKCPASHPVAVPRLDIEVHYAVRGGSGVTLSSGSAYSAHGDFFNAWDPAELARQVKRCLNGGVICNAV